MGVIKGKVKGEDGGKMREKGDEYGRRQHYTARTQHKICHNISYYTISYYIISYYIMI